MLDARAGCSAVALAVVAGLLVVSFPVSASAQSGGRGGGVSGFTRSPAVSSFGRAGGTSTTGGSITGEFTSGRSLASPPPTLAPVPGPLPPSAVGRPAPQVAPIAPLAPPTTSTFLGGGGTTVTTPIGTPATTPGLGVTSTFPGGGGTLGATPGGITTTVTTPSGLTTNAPGAGVTSTFPGGGGGSPTTSTAPSTPGGGGDTFEACMGFWDAGTHMTKREWAASCRRMLNRLQSLKSELNAAAARSSELKTPAAPARQRFSRSRSR